MLKRLNPKEDQSSLPSWKTPSIWQGIQFLRDPYRFLDSCGEHLGHTFLLRLGRKPGRCVVFSRAEDLKEIFQSPDDLLGYHPRSKNVFGYLPEDSVILSEGQDHQRRKRVFIERLQRLARIDHQRTVDRLIRSNFGGGGAIELHDVVERTMSRVVCAYVFGSILEDSEFEWLYRHASRERNRMSVFSNGFLSRNLLRRSDPSRNNRSYGVVQQFIREFYLQRRHTSESLVALVAEDDHRADFVAERTVEIFAFLFGTLTVSSLHGLYAYLQHEDARRYLNAAFQNHQEPSKCPFHDKGIANKSARIEDHSSGESIAEFFKEVWRLYPDVPMTFRCAYRDGTIGGVSFGAGDVLVPCLYLLHRHDDHFRMATDFQIRRPKSETMNWMASGGGSRKCPGISFALKAMTDLFTGLLRNYEIVPIDVPDPKTRLTTGMQAYRTGRFLADVKARS